LDDTGNSIAVGLDNRIYVTGLFLNAGGSSAVRIASWTPNTSSWSALSTGLNNPGNALALSLDGRLYAGGQFTTAGGITVNHVAVWNGTSWDSLGGGGADADIFILSFGQDGILYAGGDFTTIGGITLTDNIARWNQYAWAHLDVNLPGTTAVRAILASPFSDPIIEQNYDLWVGTNNTGVGTFAGIVTAMNEGSVQAFPKIVYARAGGTTAVIETLRNETTGKELLFDYPLLDGETLVIDLDPLAKSIESSFFGSRLDAVLANSDFGTWSLTRGDSNVASYINESGTPTLTHFMLWREQYSGYD